MQENIIPLKLEYITEVLEQIDDHLLSAQISTLLRIRAGALVEELFSSLLRTEGAQTARVRITYPAPNQIRLQYRNERGTLTPDPDMLDRLLQSACTYGVKARLEPGSCTFAVGVR